MIVLPVTLPLAPESTTSKVTNKENLEVIGEETDKKAEQSAADVAFSIFFSKKKEQTVLKRKETLSRAFLNSFLTKALPILMFVDRLT